MSVLGVDRERGLALCARASDPERHSSIEIALVGDVAVGDGLLVHAGTAIAHLGSEVTA
jgi:hydrogenase maturation factor